MKTLNENLQKHTLIAALLAATLAGCDGQEAKAPDEAVATPKVAESKPVTPPVAPAAPSPAPAALTPAPKPAQPAPPTAPYHATLEEGIDFGRDSFPDFLQEVKGLMPRAKNGDGRQSDASSFPSIRLVFKNQLPKKYTMIIDGAAFRRNANIPGKIISGSFTRPITFAAEIDPSKQAPKETLKIDMNTKDGETIIDIIPPSPAAPNEIGHGNSSTIKLGYYIRSIKFVTKK